VHAVMGTGGAPEGVITAAAMRCLNGEIQGRLVLTKPADRERCEKMGIPDLNKVYRTQDLAPGANVIFSATGVTDGSLLRGARFFGDGVRTQTLVMTTVPHQVRFVDTIHAKDDPDVKIRF
jgi:fructose-1,6-bisphosphatase II